MAEKLRDKLIGAWTLVDAAQSKSVCVWRLVQSDGRGIRTGGIVVFRLLLTFPCG